MTDIIDTLVLTKNKYLNQNKVNYEQPKKIGETKKLFEPL